MNNQEDLLVNQTDALGKPVGTGTSPRPTLKFLRIPFIGFLVLEWITFGLFRRYWLYSNWKAVKKAEQSDISPFWRAFFGIFFAAELFQRITAAAISQGYKNIRRDWAGFYMLMYLLCRGIGFLFILINRAYSHDVLAVRINILLALYI